MKHTSNPSEPQGAPAGWPFPNLDRSEFDCLEPWQKIEIQGLVREAAADFRKTTKPVGVVALHPTAGRAPIGPQARAPGRPPKNVTSIERARGRRRVLARQCEELQAMYWNKVRTAEALCNQIARLDPALQALGLPTYNADRVGG